MALPVLYILPRLCSLNGGCPSAGDGQSWLALSPPFPHMLKPFLTARSATRLDWAGGNPDHLSPCFLGLQAPWKNSSVPTLEINWVERHAPQPGVPDPPPSPPLIPYPPCSPHNNGHVFSFLRSGNLSKRSGGAHAELQVNVSSLLQSTSCKDLCSIFMDYGLRQALGNEVTVQYTQETL